MSVMPSEVTQNERTVHTNFFDGTIQLYNLYSSIEIDLFQILMTYLMMKIWTSN